MVYHHGSGAGSPALHSNLFRYKLIHAVGGWWLDLDVLLMESVIPRNDAFFAVDARNPAIAAVLKFSKGDWLLGDAIARCTAVPERGAKWGQTGPDVINELIDTYGLRGQVQPVHTVYPLDYNETVKLFDPACFDEVVDRSRSSPFFHTFHEFRRASGFPSYAGPPEGSFLDFMFTKYRLPENFPYRVELDHVARWFQNQIDLNTYKTLYEGTAIELERKA